MRILHISLFIISCVVIEIHSERTRGMCNGCEGYTRIKRAKYYNRPQRYYKRPPVPFPRGYNTPSAEYDNNQPPQSFRPKVSKRPIYEAPDDDINNLIKQLSKQDLNQIIDFAYEKQRESPKYNQEPIFETPNFIDIPDFKVYDSRIVNKNQNSLDIDNDEKFSLDGPFVSDQEDYQTYSIDYSQPTENNFQNPNPPRYQDIEPSRYQEVEPSTYSANVNRNNKQPNAYFNKEPIQNQQYFPNNNVQQSVNNYNDSDGYIFTDSTMMQEEELPKPSNLREDDYEVSFTNNVPIVVKSDSESYKVEDFGALPLMNYHSKLDTVDSYRVPHYTVTSPNKYVAPPHPNVQAPPVEPAPPIAAAQQQSDAHLKAIKIWTHRSKGTAYTLHSDGSLSLERPSRPKPTYGHP